MNFPLLPRVTYWWHAESESAFRIVGEVDEYTAMHCDEIDERTYNALTRDPPINRQD